MTEQWDMRSNIKASPGSQGTLFRAADKGLLNPDQRWPKGYTPERQEAVKSALKDIPVQGRYEADGPHQRARIEDTVARSTVPTHHLSGLKQVDAKTKEGSSGTYWGRSNRLAVDMLDRRSWANDDSGQTLIHELGHHRDAVSGGGSAGMATDERIERTAYMHNPGKKINTTMKIMADDSTRKGLAEGYADNYMEENYRTRGRNPQPVTEGRYEGKRSSADLDYHYPGYHDIRPPREQRNLGPQFSQSGLFE